MAANKLIETARSYIGVAEGSAAHKAIIDKYNTIKPLPRGYRATYMDAWCAVFVSFCALMSGVVLPYECGCQEMYKAFPDKRGRAATPGLGWVIFYDWQGDGHTEHVGIVESVKDGVITVIEGNHNDLRACEFDRVKGGKPFNVRNSRFRKMLKEIGQPRPRKTRVVKK